MRNNDLLNKLDISNSDKKILNAFFYTEIRILLIILIVTITVTTSNSYVFYSGLFYLSIETYIILKARSIIKKFRLVKYKDFYGIK